MADFKTTLERLSRHEVEFDSVAKNIDKLLKRKPHAAVTLMDQLKQAVAEDVIDTETYARLKSRVAAHLEAPVGAEDEESTVFAGADDTDSGDIFDITGTGSSDDHIDATVVADPDADEATQILDGTAAATPMTGSGQTTGIDFDLTSDAGPSTGSSWPDGGVQTGQTGTDWAQPGDASATTTKLGPGGVLRGRFQLDEILGVGGMGSVYLGSDLIKVRAKDKQPRVALKVLNEDFKQHPDSFIALQREASRQQKLAHPNIATVYDFDQTEDGLAFLVMELLEGEPLNDFIKKAVKPKGGLPFEEAYPMVEGLGNALVYAHDRNIVHSDFKPGNCFITKEGQMKVLDFGIARAVKAPGAAEGETTIFDPGKLGALTPAYASVEMLEGEEPDTRDDIYALACVAYELLTGKHPFNKIPANKARDSGLVAEPIKTLTRKQWRGLERGLAFKREDRSQNTAEFLEEFQGATSPWKNPFIMGPAAAALILLAGFFPAKNYLEEQDLKARIELAQTGDVANIESVLQGFEVDELSGPARDRVLNEAKEQILSYFDGKARGQINVTQGAYDFTGAKQTLARAKSYTVLQDSLTLVELDEFIVETENRLFAEQFDKFNAALENGNLTEIDGEDDIFDAMAIVRKVDPNHPMLTDRRIPGVYADAINEALENEDYEYAEELGDLGIGLMADNANLNNLLDKIAGEKDRAETAQRILRALATIEEAKKSDKGLAAYSLAGSAIGDLAIVDPTNEILNEVRKVVEPLATRDLEALESSKKWGASGLMAGDFNGLLRGLGLHDLNTRAKPLGEEFDTTLSAARAEVTAAVAGGDLENAASSALTSIESISPYNRRTDNARDQVARAHLRTALAAHAESDFDAAKAALSRAERIGGTPSVAALIESESSRLEAEQALDDSARAALVNERTARFDADYDAFNTAVGALGTDAAAYKSVLKQLDHLRGLNPADSRIVQAEDAIGQAVNSNAPKMGEAGAWDDAVDVTRSALIQLPRISTLATSLASIEAERKEAIVEQQRQMVADSKRTVESLLSEPTADRDWRANVRRSMETVAAFGEPGDTWLTEYGEKIGAIYVERAIQMRGEQRLAEGANLLADAERFAPQTPGLDAEREALAAATEAFEAEQAEQARLARIEGLKQTFETQARANDAANASKTLENLRAELGETEDPFVTRDAPRMLAGAYFKLATQRAQNQDFAAALRFAQECNRLQSSRSDCRNAIRDYGIEGSVQALNAIFERGGTFDVSDALSKLSDVQTGDPGRFNDSESTWAQAMASRLEVLKDSAGTGANEFIEETKRIFGDDNTLIAAISPVTTEVAPSRYAGEVNAAMEKALLGEARKLLKQASETESEHPDIVRLKGMFNARVKDARGLYDTYKQQYKDAEYESALQTMEQALTVWADSGTFKKEHARVVAKLNEQAASDGSAPAQRIIPAALPPTNPCESSLAGHGKRKKGTCFYFVSGNQRGPLMVVVPPGEGFSSGFAIGKYEITVGDFNRYCGLSGDCQPVKGKESRLPMTDITLEQARAYTEWLSGRTGQTYRLPSADEWNYAANAGGKQPKKDYNCRVEQGGQLLKGQGTMGVNTGKANGWGLYNYVGNVQEWVVAGDGVTARGGAFEDAFSKCDIGLEKSHDGTADGATGFRVLLELGSG